LALSYRLELISKELPEYTHNFRLNMVNIIVCLLNVAIPAIVLGLKYAGKDKAAYNTYAI
jgi:hypothetical protein